MSPEPLSDDEITDALRALPGWEVVGGALRRTYAFSGHLPAAAMVVHVAALQEELNHHSEQTLGYASLAISVHTHSVGGAVTRLDTELAARIEEIAPGHGAR